MRSKCRGTESCYNAGCRSEQCRQAATEARRERRRLAREAVGELPAADADRTRLVSIPTDNPSTSINADISPANSVEAAVLAEVQALGSTARPGLVAGAIAMARILDNPKAISSQPPAARVLISMLEKLRSGSTTRRGNLALVKSMTEKGGA